MALSYALFLIPLHIVPGGVSGISIIINYVSPKIPVGVLSILLDLPIFYMGVKKLGKNYGAKTILGMFLTYLSIDFLYEIVGLKTIKVTDNILLGSIYGGVLLGIGLGLIFKGGASTGGTDTIGWIINKYTGWSVGIAILMVDSFVIFGGGIVYHSLEAPLIGFLNLFLSTKVIDFVLEGMDYAKMAIIISEKQEPIRDFILKDLDRSGTVFFGETLYKGSPAKTIMTVVSRREFQILQQEVRKIDPKAFVVISNVYEVLGEGFRTRNY